MLLAISNPCFSFPQLLGQLARDLVNGGIEVVLSMLGIDVGPWHRKMHLYNMLLGFRLVVKQNHMSCEDAIGKLLQMAYLFSHVCVDGGSKGQMSGAKVDLHAEKNSEIETAC